MQIQRRGRAQQKGKTLQNLIFLVPLRVVNSSQHNELIVCKCLLFFFHSQGETKLLSLMQKGKKKIFNGANQSAMTAFKSTLRSCFRVDFNFQFVFFSFTFIRSQFRSTFILMRLCLPSTRLVNTKKLVFKFSGAKLQQDEN